MSKKPNEKHNDKTNRLWAEFRRIIHTHKLPSQSAWDEIYEVKTTNKKNGIVLTTLGAMDIALRKLKRRYEEEVS